MDNEVIKGNAVNARSVVNSITYHLNSRETRKREMRCDSTYNYACDVRVHGDFYRLVITVDWEIDNGRYTLNSIYLRFSRMSEVANTYNTNKNA